jgi:Ca2+-binding RTX toxin-like protein
MQQKEEKEKEEVLQQRKQKKLFSAKSPQISLTVLFTGLILMMAATISAPMVAVVYAANIQGTAGDDTLNGTPKADTINGLDGNDKLFGKSGDDALDGGNGDDEIYGGPGNDEIKDGGEFSLSNKVYGGSGNDNIDVGDDPNTNNYYIYGEAGDDFIKVLANTDISGGAGADTIYCEGFECSINGDSGHDEIHVNSPNQFSVAGGSGNDKVFGIGYWVFGQDGNDYLSLDWAVELNAGEGNDILEASSSTGHSDYIGGHGADTFRCSPGPGDIVQDYNPAEGDRISAANCDIVEDATPPDVQIIQAVDEQGREISDGGTTNSRYIKITFEATEGDIGGISNIACILDGKYTDSCKSPVVYDELSEGTHEFIVRAYDSGHTKFGDDEFTWTIG